MTEKLMHLKLKQEAVQLLISKGYSKENIIVDKKYINIDYFGGKQSFRVDVYGSNGSIFAVECGNFPKWKRPLYEQYFGKENIIHLPYPPGYGKSLITTNNELNPVSAKQFLIKTYTDQIYSIFKNDLIFDFQEFTEVSKELFDIDNHHTYREINPDYSLASETDGRKIWMNFPDSQTISKEEFKHKLHWGMIYYPGNKLGITMIFSGRDACEQFLDLSLETHRKIQFALQKLPPKFKTRDGNSFWKKSSRPPLDKEWNNPIPCNELSWEDYEEILNNLANIIYLQKKGFKVGPVLDLVKIICDYSEVAEAIDCLKELYTILLKPETKTDRICDNIKGIDSWDWYIDNSREWGSLHQEYSQKYGQIVSDDEFKKACRYLRKKHVEKQE